MFRHVVLFRVRTGVSAEAIDEAVRYLRAAVASSGAPGEVAISEDLRKGVVIVEDMSFESEADLINFRRSVPHAEAAEMLGAISDWLVGDWVSETKATPA
tara:strand:- start:3646 stop:3945 length:300 start_codon:yes stop_codon:yes gene_type:complete